MSSSTARSKGALRVLVTGATGAIGPFVAEAFHEKGYRVRTLSRTLTSAGVLRESVDRWIGDVTDRSAVKAAMEGVDSVVHLAALLHIVNPSPELEKDYRNVNVEGTSVVVGEAVRAGIRRIVLASTIAVYGGSGGNVLSEDSPVSPDTFYARTKHVAERIVLDAKDVEGGPIGSVLRFGAVYGSRVKGNYQRLVQSLARGRFVPVGTGTNRRTLVYEKDAADAVVLAATHDRAAGKIFNVSDGSFHSMNEIVCSICDALGRKPPAFHLPVTPVRWAAGFVEDVSRLLGMKPLVTRGTIDKYNEDIAVDSNRIQRELGFVPRYDLSSGWKETLYKMRLKGVLR